MVTLSYKAYQLKARLQKLADDRYPEKGPYKIIRVYHPKYNKTPRKIKGGLTLTEAQKHTKDPSTRKEGEYFDAFDNDD